MRGSDALRAFTLVELLVVMAVIAALGAVLLPSLGTARHQARDVQCLSNLRQIGLAMHAYAADSAGFFPMARYSDPPRKAVVCWDTITYAGSTAPAAPGLIWQYAHGGKVQQCPAFRGPSMTAADPYSGYNYNTTYIGRGEGEPPCAGLTEGPAAESMVRFATRAALVGDGGYRDGANKFMRAPNDPIGERLAHAGTQAYRHRGRTQVVFVDGHGAPTGQKYRKPGVRASIEVLMGFPNNAFLSADDSAYVIR